MRWLNRIKQFLQTWIGEGILFSISHGLWLSRLNATVVLVLIVAMYIWQYGSLALNQQRLEKARVTVQLLQFDLIAGEDKLFEDQKHLQTLHKADETFRAIQQLTADRFSTEETVELANIILRQSRLYGYDPLLIVAIIQVESRFRSAARGRYRSGRLSGAKGLMQIKQSTAESLAKRFGMELSSQDLMDAETNVMWGITYLTRLLLHYRDLRTAIIAYNLGMGAVQSRLSRGDILPKRYYHSVMNYYGLLRGEIQG